MSPRLSNPDLSWGHLSIAVYSFSLRLVLAIISKRGRCEPMANCFNGLLNGFLDFPATETACADPNAFRLTVDHCPDWLEVGLEDPLCLIIGVTDVMAGLATFATEIACKCHGYTPLSNQIDTQSQRLKCNTGLFIVTSSLDGRLT